MHEQGQLVQYFDNALLIFQPSLADTPQVIALAPLGQRALSAPSSRLASFDNTTTRRYYPQTGHSLSGDFLAFWRKYGAMDVFGPPISEQITEQGKVVQYFQNVRLEADSSAGSAYFGTRVSTLGDTLLRQKGWMQ